MPTVIIINGQSFDERYHQILQSIDQRFHSYKTTFPEYPTTEAEYGELEAMAAHASHAGGDGHADHLYVNGVHIERLIK